jgi:predicted ATPase
VSSELKDLLINALGGVLATVILAMSTVLVARLFSPKKRELLQIYEECVEEVLGIPRKQVRRVLREKGLQKHLLNPLIELDREWEYLREAFQRHGVPEERLASSAGFYEKLVRRMRLSDHCADWGNVLEEQLQKDEREGEREVPAKEVPAAPAPPPEAIPFEQPRLPAFPTPFMGRETEVGQVKKLLLDENTRVLMLVGTAGVGKTRLSARVAEEAAEQFPNGVWFIPVETATNQQWLFARIASTLPIEPQPSQSDEQRVLNYLANKKLLLVLDNLEQIPDLPEAVHKILQAAPGVKLFLTSRERFPISGSRVFDLSPLRLPPATGTITPAALMKIDSAQFFIRRVQDYDYDFEVTEENAADIARLCRQLGGVPLALELAAPQALDMTPREILAQIQEQLDFLAVEYPNLPERQRTLRASIDWSYSRLAPQDQRVFARLSVFVDGFSPEAAAAVCAEEDILDDLRRLHGKSLLTRQQLHQRTRYGMLNTIHLYAKEKLKAQPDAEKVRARHADYFLQFARERIGKVRTADEPVALAEFETDLENIRSAMDWSQESGRQHLCAEYALVMGSYLQRCGFQREAMRRVQMGLDAAQELPDADLALRARLLRERAGLHLDRHEWEEARRHATAALALFEQLKDIQEMADANNLLGLAARGEKKYDEARHYFGVALEQFQQGGEEIGIATAQHNLALVEYLDGNREEAARRWQEALRLRRNSGDKRGMAEVLTNLGALAVEQGKLDESWRYHLEALQFEKELRHVYGVGRSLCNLGEVVAMRGDQEKADLACRLFLGAERLFDEVGSPHRAYAAEQLGCSVTQFEYAEETMTALRSDLQGKALDDLIDWALDGEVRE